MARKSSPFNNSTRALLWVAPFLERLRLVPNVTDAAAAVGIDRSTCYKHREKSAEFSTLMDAALDEGADRLEKEAWRRAVDGVSKPVYQGGVLVGHIQEYSDTLMCLLLKGHKPEKYRERVSQEITGANNGPLQVLVYLPEEDAD